MLFVWPIKCACFISSKYCGTRQSGVCSSTLSCNPVAPQGIFVI